MKHLSKLSALLLIAGVLVACGSDSMLDSNGNIRFPDTKFAAYMVEHFDTNGDGGISPAEAATITQIECPGMEIESLAGIKHCTELTYLDCGYKYENGNFTYNKLITLDVNKNTKLTGLNCSGNQLTTLNVSKNTKLAGLLCSYNQLTALDVSKNTELAHLVCSNNQLTALDVRKNTKLDYLDCSDNQLTALDVSKNTKLAYLRCYDNQLTTLDASMTNLGNSSWTYPLCCDMESLKTLYLKTGWELWGINNPRDTDCIHPNTQIEYKD